MKNNFTIYAILALVTLAMSSCYKTHHCYCQIKTVAQDTQDTVKWTDSHHTIKGAKIDAEDACKYYETEEDFLQRPAINYHYCAIDDDYEK